MSKVSRRAISKYIATELATGKSSKKIAEKIAAYLVDSGKSSELDFLINDIYYELEKRGLLVNANITSAVELNNKIKSQITNQIKNVMSAKEVSIENNIDKSVIGGLRVETSTRVWDDTISNKLSNLSEAF